MATVDENEKKIRDFATKSGISEKDLVDACRQIATKADQITAQGMLEAVTAAAEAAEPPHDRIKRKLFGGPK